MTQSYKGYIELNLSDFIGSKRIYLRENLRIKANGVSVIFNSDFIPDIDNYTSINLLGPAALHAVFHTQPIFNRPFLKSGVEYFCRLDEIYTSLNQGKGGKYFSISNYFYLDETLVGFTPLYKMRIYQFDEILSGY